MKKKIDLAVELSEEDKLALEAEAKAEIESELLEEKKQAFKEAARKRIQQQAMFQEGKDEDGDYAESITLELAPMQHSICIDGKHYLHGKTYRLPRKVIQVIKDQQYQGWRQEEARTKEKATSLFARQKVLGSNGLRHA